PSTKIQLDFAQVLAEECKSIGLQNVSVDEYGYVTATLPGTVSSTPVIGLIAHMDTCPDASGENIQPNIVENYDGGTILLKEGMLSPEEFPFLKDYIGQTLITTDGTTLLGADDKAGIAEILTAMEYLIAHPEIPHGDIRIAFTPDEEVGRGVDFFNVENFNADFAYTLDGGRIGELEYENFNAARALVKIHGKNVHPGYAKDIMVNAALIGTEIAAALPANETPAKTENYEGFFHLCSFEGTTTYAELDYIIRDFDKTSFENRKELIQSIVDKKNVECHNCIELELTDQYYNMISQIEPHMEIVDLAKQAMLDCGITPLIRPIRGGTDGARLSFMGLPCPNLFAGGHNFHSNFEFVPVESMEKAVEMIVRIAELATSLDFQKSM
ncbi:MAG: peptidase T, partial [Anaerotignum sp.]|nr:peptidase T [Anaerotignum sp.]